MFARFDENPAMTLEDIKETKRYGRTDGRTHGRTHGQRENSIPTTNKVCGGYNNLKYLHSLLTRYILQKFFPRKMLVICSYDKKVNIEVSCKQNCFTFRTLCKCLQNSAAVAEQAHTRA